MTDTARNPSGVRRRLVPVLAAATVLAVLLGGGYAIRGSSDDSAGGAGAPPVLRLTDYQATAADTSTGDNDLRLSADLPAGPDDAAVRWLTSPDSAEVERLAKALGLRGQRARGGGATTYTSDSASLRVQERAGGSWQYTRGGVVGGGVACPPDSPSTSKSDDPDLTVSCDVAVPVPLGEDSVGSTGSAPTLSPPSGVTTRKLPATTPETARAAARQVLEAVGIDLDDARVQANAPQAVVVADPAVEDLPTYGMATSVMVFGKRVTAAGGWLGGSREGATYPVISARAAWQRLVSTPMPRPLIACPEPAPSGSDPMMCGGPITVTGARFGLSLHEENGRPVLVPSWLFDVRDSQTPLSVVAVDPRYLGQPRVSSPGTSDPGSSGSGSGGSGSGGSTGTAVPPVAPSTDPDQPSSPESRFSSVTASGNELAVTFTGGVAACYSYTVVAKETGSQVTLSLVEKTPDSDKPCVEMAQVYERKVPLDKPLGARQVVDDETGAVLLGPSR